MEQNNNHPYQNLLPLLPYDVIKSVIENNDKSLQLNNLLELHSRRVAGISGVPLIIYDVPGGRFSFLTPPPSLNSDNVNIFHEETALQIIHDVFKINFDPKEQVHIEMKKKISDILQKNYIL